MTIPRAAQDSRALVEARWGLLGTSAATQAALADEASRQDPGRFARNIENFIGTVKVPVGIAGPLRVRGMHAQGDYYVPLATTEAALVASYSRGAQLITEAGGCAAALLAEGVTRAPGFAFATLGDAAAFARWAESEFPAIAAIAAGTSSHARLVALRASVEGNHVYLELEFLTGQAAGQNMVTIATAAVLRHIAAHSPVRCEYCFLESNHSGDKKASMRSLGGVRGKRVSAEVRLSRALVIERLHTVPERMADYWRMAALAGVLTGTVGVQGQFANGLAALYLACGQDVACVAESATGVTRLEVARDGGLYACVTLPSVIVGSVGGGTGLPSQRACLEILGAHGPADASALAEVCAAVALAGELSLIAAVCSGDFARAHAERARGVALARQEVASA
jgi:hydroxymethylglutaryl-CoA reductase (NADPH)